MIRRKSVIGIALFSTVFAAFVAESQAATYYVRSDFTPSELSTRSQPGFTEDGLTQVSAYDSLEDVERIDSRLNPGDEVLFKRGSSWTGKLTLQNVQGSSGEGNEVLFSHYGDIDDPAPFINGNGEQEAVLIKNCSYTIFEHFKISNKMAGEPNALGEGNSFPDNQRYGAKLEASAEGEIFNLTFRHNEITEVFGLMDKGAGLQGGGAGLVIRGNGVGFGDTRDPRDGRFNGLFIEDNHIHNCVRNGVWGVYDYASNGVGSNGIERRRYHYYHQNVVFRRNLVEQIPGDGLIIWGCEGAIVEHNIFRDFTPLRHEPANAAIAVWTIKSKDTLFQHNAVTGHLAEHDGQAFDADFDSKGSIYQYNYTADNIGGFALLIGASSHLSFQDPATRDTIFRHNLSFNDGFRVDSAVNDFRNWGPLFHFTGGVTNTRIYNNTFYMEPKPATVERELLVFGTWPRDTADGVYFQNNVFFGTEDMAVTQGPALNLEFDSNLYYRISQPSQEINYIQGSYTGANDYDVLLTDPLNYADQAAIVPGNTLTEDFFGNALLPKQIGVYAGEEADVIEMPDRLVEDTGALNITQPLTAVTVEVINLLGDVVMVETPGTLATGDYPFSMQGHDDGIYYILVYAAEFGGDAVYKKFVKVDPFSTNPPIPVPVTGIVLNASSDPFTLIEGATEAPILTLEPVNANSPLVWSSDAPGIATVHPTTGQVNAVSPGSVLIRVQAIEDPSIEGTLLVTVVPASGATGSSNTGGGVGAPALTVTPDLGSATLTWSVGNNSDGIKYQLKRPANPWSDFIFVPNELASAGHIVADLAPGSSYQIKAKSYNQTNESPWSSTVTFSTNSSGGAVLVSSLFIDPTLSDPFTLNQGTSEMLTVTTGPADADDPSVTWSSDRPSDRDGRCHHRPRRGPLAGHHRHSYYLQRWEPSEGRDRAQRDPFCQHPTV
jgi:hypothetical protein